MKNNSNVIVSIYRGDKINKYYWIFGNTEYGLQYWNTYDAEKITNTKTWRKDKLWNYA